MGRQADIICPAGLSQARGWQQWFPNSEPDPYTSTPFNPSARMVGDNVVLADLAADAPAAHEDAGANDDDEDDGQMPLKIETVTRISVGKRCWYPEIHEVEGRVYVTLSKNDPSLCALVKGKGMNRHVKREAINLNVQWWTQVRQLRN